ncbi:uncharacterized protein LOC119988114 [Tripterygium wilfordii]|uniref:uncharacterized protein LOC119988114 n=1 Tax=Tripterygium wilfordii TaxID=458696 RepID=UPI0018F85672|nr:uncharacterized protein LOC119988114 [Tripterygium wilfordii]XP_038688967.1 uncharacterized protein LOC119988114 [Tripterygium wilfordii]XP_038688968.1 uncharacterized protein LOC119988114 [Tripterygium wilfordii]XP_038688969.1 uncharacterized protein LOC119988114 [Tripterygium wilfordii]
MKQTTKMGANWPTVRFLGAKNKRNMELIQKAKSPIDFIWKGSKFHYSVMLQDLFDILKGNSIINNVIDAYGEILMANASSSVEPIFDNKVLIFNSLCCSYIKNDGMYGNRKRWIDDVLQNMKVPRYMLFPINSTGGWGTVPNHWTLLVLNVEKQAWTHYNSFLPSDCSRNTYLEDAKLIVCRKIMSRTG